VGALFVRKGIRIHGVQTGGSQEKKRRGGTLNVPGIVGFGEAVRIAMEEKSERLNHLNNLKTLLLRKLTETFGDRLIHNHPENSSPHILSVSFKEELGIDGQLLLMKLDMAGLCVSSGSACSAGTITPSHVLKSIGRSDYLASSAVRMSFGYQNTEDEILQTVSILKEVFHSLKNADEVI
jgi:cysteine desulfurase